MNKTSIVFSDCPECGSKVKDIEQQVVDPEMLGLDPLPRYWNAQNKRVIGYGLTPCGCFITVRSFIPAWDYSRHPTIVMRWERAQ